MTEQWFDALSVALMRVERRRWLLRAAGILGVGLLPSFRASTGRVSAKPKKKKGKKKSKPSPTPPPTPCSAGACAAEPTWAGDQTEIDYCEFICRQCDGDDSRDFCIIEDFKGHDGDKVAVCCAENQKCCDGKNCCDRAAQCCNGACCGSAPDFQCCDGACFNTKRAPDHCGECGNACGDGQECRDGRCGCLQPCPEGKNCIHTDGSLCVEVPNRTDCHCDCPPGFNYCFNRLSGRMVCFSGDCSLIG